MKKVKLIFTGGAFTDLLLEDTMYHRIWNRYQRRMNTPPNENYERDILDLNGKKVYFFYNDITCIEAIDAPEPKVEEAKPVEAIEMSALSEPEEVEVKESAEVAPKKKTGQKSK